MSRFKSYASILMAAGEGADRLIAGRHCAGVGAANGDRRSRATSSASRCQAVGQLVSGPRPARHDVAQRTHEARPSTASRIVARHAGAGSQRGASPEPAGRYSRCTRSSVTWISDGRGSSARRAPARGRPQGLSAAARARLTRTGAPRRSRRRSWHDRAEPPSCDVGNGDVLRGRSLEVTRRGGTTQAASGARIHGAGELGPAGHTELRYTLASACRRCGRDEQAVADLAAGHPLAANMAISVLWRSAALVPRPAPSGASPPPGSCRQAGAALARRVAARCSSRRTPRPARRPTRPPAPGCRVLEAVDAEVSAAASPSARARA